MTETTTPADFAQGHLRDILHSVTLLRKPGLDLTAYATELDEIEEVLADIADAARPAVSL
jgi:hypothetical protein